jgi:hypothetical protein
MSADKTLEQMESGQNPPPKSGGIVATNSRAVVRSAIEADAKMVTDAITAYIKKRDAFIPKALGATSLGGGSDAPFDLSGLFPE